MPLSIKYSNSHKTPKLAENLLFCLRPGRKIAKILGSDHPKIAKVGNACMNIARTVDHLKKSFYFWDEEFFGMSSYKCENFQLFILYNFEFHHMMLKRLPEGLNSILTFFKKRGFFDSCPFLIFLNFII